VIVVDANLLLYAYNPSAAEHERARDWVEDTFSSGEIIGLPWSTVLAFLRIGTNPRAFPRPLTISEAATIVSEWLALPGVRIPEPGDRHWSILAPLLAGARVRGPLVSDAHLAALAIEHGATLYTTDGDFARFPRLRWVNPVSG
jgi:toxin-antitoxin system PIN domain toxin